MSFFRLPNAFERTLGIREMIKDMSNPPTRPPRATQMSTRGNRLMARSPPTSTTMINATSHHSFRLNILFLGQDKLWSTQKTAIRLSTPEKAPHATYSPLRLADVIDPTSEDRMKTPATLTCGRGRLLRAGWPNNHKNGMQMNIWIIPAGRNTDERSRHHSLPGALIKGATRAPASTRASEDGPYHGLSDIGAIFQPSKDKEYRNMPR